MQVAVGVELDSLASSASRRNYRFTFVAVVQLDVENIDTQLLKNLQRSSQSADLMFQGEDNWCSITAGLLNFARWLFLLSSTQKHFLSRETTPNNSFIITANSFGLWIGLPSFTAHSFSPLRYSQRPRRDFPEADMFSIIERQLSYFESCPNRNPVKSPTAGLIGKLLHRID